MAVVGRRTVQRAHRRSYSECQHVRMPAGVIWLTHACLPPARRRRRRRRRRRYRRRRGSRRAGADFRAPSGVCGAPRPGARKRNDNGRGLRGYCEGNDGGRWPVRRGRGGGGSRCSVWYRSTRSPTRERVSTKWPPGGAVVACCGSERGRLLQPMRWRGVFNGNRSEVGRISVGILWISVKTSDWHRLLFPVICRSL